MGGKSAEREISLMSGGMVLEGAAQEGRRCACLRPAERDLFELSSERFARVFIALHGRFGEDGTRAGRARDGSAFPTPAAACSARRSPWTRCAPSGCGRRGHADARRTPCSTRTRIWQRSAQRLGLPLFVKPASEGSSVGMTKVRKRGALDEAYALAVNYDPVVHRREVHRRSGAHRGDRRRARVPLIRIETPRKFYDYEASTSPTTRRYLIPCGVPAKKEKEI